jgi:hypothetical protein
MPIHINGLNSFMSGLTEREQGRKRSLSAGPRRYPNSEKFWMCVVAWDGMLARFRTVVTQ